MTRVAAIWFVLACAGQGFAFAPQGPPQVPLRKVVADEGCKTSGLPSAVASALVESFAVLHDDAECVIAFFRDLQRDGTPLEVISSRGKSRAWIYGRIPVMNYDRNRVAEVELDGDVLLVSIADHATPILNSNLEHLGTIYGTFVRMWPNGLIQYDSHQPHFGPHDIEIGVFNPKTGANRQIYPFIPCDAVRANFVRRYYQSHGASLSDNGALPCWSEAGIRAPMYFDWNTNTVAFALDLYYEYYQLPKWSEHAEIMVTCEGLASINSIKCRETPLEAWQTSRSDLSLTQLVRFAASQPRFR